MNKLRVLGAVCACLLFLVTPPTVASVIYTYTGNVFDTFSNSTSYDNTVAVTGTIELAAQLGANNPFNPQEEPISFSFSDGINTLTESNTDSVIFRVQTDGTGSISNWQIELVTGWTTLAVGDTNTIIGTSFSAISLTGSDKGDTRECLNGGCTIQSTDFGQIQNSPGSWTVTAVPVPAALWLFGSGLLGLIGIARHKKSA